MNKNRQSMQRLTLSALFAAMAWVVFILLRFRIPVPTPGGGILIHFANCICVLAGFVLGPIMGGLSGAIGLTLADLTAGYVHAMIPTFISKFLIGFFAGLLASKFKLKSQTEVKQRILYTALIGIIILLVFNTLFDPLLRYYIYQLVGISKELAKSYQWFNMLAAMINGFTNTVLLVVLYNSLAKAMANTTYRQFFY